MGPFMLYEQLTACKVVYAAGYSSCCVDPAAVSGREAGVISPTWAIVRGDSIPKDGKTSIILL